MINKLIKISKKYTKRNGQVSFIVNYHKHLEQEKSPFPYNKLIRDKVDNDYGVYMWVNNKNEIIYIGMAGRLKRDNENNEKVKKNGHFLSKRLIATRGKDKKTKKDIPTRKYLKDYMKKKNIKNLEFHIFYTKNEVPPSYLEAKLLYEYYLAKKQSLY